MQNPPIIDLSVTSKIAHFYPRHEAARLQSYLNNSDINADIRVEERSGILAMKHSKASFFNRVHHVKLENFDDFLKISEIYRIDNTPFQVSISPYDFSAELCKKLSKNGFTPSELHTKFAYFPQDSVEIKKIHVNGAFTIVKVDERNINDFVKVYLEVFDDELQHWPEAMRVMPSVLNIPGIHLFLGILDGKAVGAASLFLDDKTGYLPAGAVLTSARGRGIQQALICERMRVAKVSGCNLVSVGSGWNTSSFRNIQRCGFQLAWLENYWQSN